MQKLHLFAIYSSSFITQRPFRFPIEFMQSKLRDSLMHAGDCYQVSYLLALLFIINLENDFQVVAQRNRQLNSN